METELEPRMYGMEGMRMTRRSSRSMRFFASAEPRLRAALAPTRDSADLEDEREARRGQEAKMRQEGHRAVLVHRLNGRIKTIKQEKEALDDLSMELKLEDEPVLYCVGETFLHMPHARAMKRLTADQASTEEALDKLRARADECAGETKGLQVALYVKFGSAINLDE